MYHLRMSLSERLSAMRFKSLFALLFGALFMLVAGPRSSHASHSTGNQFVSAVVEDGPGWIWFRRENPHAILSFQNKSFLSLKIGSKVYSNNNVANAAGTADIQLDNGVTNKIDDTIETVWPESGFEIIQDVYPVAFEISGQIVYKVRVVNHTGTQLNVQGQYLLDVDVNGQDLSAILTRWNYTPNWTEYPSGSAPKMPWWYLSFEHSPTSGQGTGVIGTGYLIDQYAPQPMELLTPDLFATVDWNDESSFSWGPDPNAPWGTPYTAKDNAVLIEWPATAAQGSGKDTTVEVLRGSYGTGEFEICYGNFVAINFFPHRIVYDGIKHQYIHNPFHVTSIIFDAQTADAKQAVASLTVDGSERIISPKYGLRGDSLFEQQGIGAGAVQTTGGTVPSLGVADADWVDSTYDVVNCSQDSLVDWTLNVVASGPFVPAFVNPNPCEFQILVECTKTDIVAPLIDSIHKTVFADTLTVTDMTSLDRGIDNIRWTYDPPFAASNLPVKLTWQVAGSPDSTSLVSPTNFNCFKDSVRVTSRQIDTTIGGCINFVFTDCKGNVSYQQVCYGTHTPPGHFDTLAPLFGPAERVHRNPNSDTNCNGQCVNITATDNRTDDRGLEGVRVVTGSDTNMTLTVPSTFVVRDPSLTVQVCVRDSMKDGVIVLEATDSTTPTHHTFDTLRYCTYPDVLQPVLSAVLAANNASWHVHASDTQGWDRGLGYVTVTSLVNATVSAPGLTVTTVDDSTVRISKDSCGQASLDFNIMRTDTIHKSCIAVRATDCWGNASGWIQVCSDAVPDLLCPTISFDTISVDPMVVRVTVTDEHPQSADSNYDTGIEEVQFSLSHNITVTYNGSPLPPLTPKISLAKISTTTLPNYPDTVQFTLSVTDTNSSDGLPACITLNALDGVGNQLYCGTKYQWCVPVIVDTHAPHILGTNPSTTSLDVTITDNDVNDRGVGELRFDSVINFQSPFFHPYDSVYSGPPTTSLTLNVITKGQSAYARIWTQDLFGRRANTVVNHTDSADVWIYAQNLGMKFTQIVTPPLTFNVPVYLTWTDSVPLSKKDLRSYAFSFHLSGSPIVNFVGAVSTGTLSSGWTVTPVTAPLGGTRAYTVSGTTNGAALPDMTATQMAAKPLVILQFSAAATDSPAETLLNIDGTPGSEVSYNGGLPTIYSGSNYSVTLDAPYGKLSGGGQVVIKGPCSPLVGAGGTPTSISLAPTTPNPASTTALVDYTVPAEGLVHLELYDALGARVRTLVSDVQKQGEYTLDLVAKDLPQGTYFLRLESGGKVITRQVVLGR